MADPLWRSPKFGNSPTTFSVYVIFCCVDSIKRLHYTLAKVFSGSYRSLSLGSCRLSQDRGHLRMSFEILAAQCEIPPPPYRTIHFQDSIAEGVSQPFYLVFMWHRASISEIPLCVGGGGLCTSTSHALQGERLRRGGGGIAPNWSC